MTDKNKIEEALIKVFGEDDIDINTYGVTIRFEEIDITNQNGTEHTIRGLYVYLAWSYDENDNVLTFTNTMYGMRNIFTPAEIFSHYMHSHLSGYHPDDEGSEDEDGNIINPDLYVHRQDFCLGSDSISQLLGGLSLGFDIDQFQILLNTIDEFVRWESLEGGPYELIEDLQHSSNDLTEVTINSLCTFNINIMDNIYKSLLPEDISLIDYSHIKNDEITILGSSTVFFNKIEEVLNENKVFITTTRKYEDKYYLLNQGNRNIIDYTNDVEIDFEDFNFKGEIQHLEIFYPKLEDSIYDQVVEKGEVLPHPFVTQSVIKEIEKDLNKFIIKDIQEWELVK